MGWMFVSLVRLPAFLMDVCSMCAGMRGGWGVGRRRDGVDARSVGAGEAEGAPWNMESDFTLAYRLVGLVVKASASRAEDPGFRIPLATGFFSGSSHTSDLKIGTPVATLPGAWRYRVSTGTGRPGVSIL